MTFLNFKNKSNILAILTGFVVLLMTINMAKSKTLEWTVTGTGKDVRAFDCQDCDEELGMLVACQDNGRSAEITVHAVASARGQNGATEPVTFSIGEDRFTYQAKTVEFGLSGSTPVFSLSHEDPLLEALSSGRIAVASFNGIVSNIGLKGSRKALAVFKDNCAWAPEDLQENRINSSNEPANDENSGFPPYSQTVLKRLPPEPDADGAFWFTGNGFGNGAPKTLRYGIPETDAVALFASCDDVNVDGVLLEIYTPFGSANSGDPVNLEFTADEFSANYPATVFIEGEEYVGTRTVIPQEDAIWEKLAEKTKVTFAIKGQPGAVVNGQSGKAALLEFHGLCKG